MRRFLIALIALALLATACGGSSGDDVIAAEDAMPATDASEAASTDTEAPAPATTVAATTTEAAGPATHAVPADFPTIQAAVDAAAPGDMIMISPGTYNENVVVDTEDIVIRGMDRNEVILDGEFERENGFIVFSDGVSIENMTVHSYTSNGVFITGDYGEDIVVDGYRVSYVTTYNNGLYGIYAFNATNGLMEESYGSGHPDSAFYIGQCDPCNAVIRNSISENNALGYSGTNAGGDLYVINNVFRHNRVGVVPNTLDSEELAPQHDATFAGNYIHDNGNEATPRRGAEWDLAFGVGLVFAGGNDNVALRNRVENNPYGGIAAAAFVDDNIWPAERNTIKDNVVSGSENDLFLLVLDPAAGAAGNCFEGNTFETSIPANIETEAACGGGTGALSGNGVPNGGTFTVTNYEEMPVPGPQPTMPDADTAPAAPAGAPTIDLDAVLLPA